MMKYDLQVQYFVSFYFIVLILVVYFSIWNWIPGHSDFQQIHILCCTVTFETISCWVDNYEHILSVFCGNDCFPVCFSILFTMHRSKFWTFWRSMQTLKLFGWLFKFNEIVTACGTVHHISFEVSVERWFHHHSLRRARNNTSIFPRRKR